MSGLPRVGPEQQQRYQPRLNNEHLWTMPEVLIDIEPHSVTRSVRAHFSLRFVDGGAPPQASSPDIDAEVIEYVEISAPDAPSSTLHTPHGSASPASTSVGTRSPDLFDSWESRPHSPAVSSSMASGLSPSGRPRMRSSS
mmetsp:Transcript_47076/g.131284  ORF Transcript_47076/g.131284 Transcript_47076/m.131284 type:complete len:140 (-) Transcript_47076:113-532(-)